MADEPARDIVAPPSEPHWLAAAMRRTPARVFVGRAGPAYSTATQLALRADHAFALDAVHDEVRLEDFPPDFVAARKLFAVQSLARNKQEYLLRPDLGRRLSDAAREALARSCPQSPAVQIVLGDGLSAAAVIRQVPPLLPLLEDEVRRRGWQLGQTFLVRYCRVGIMNDVGELLDPAVVVLLIGERPGLATAESLSAYLAFRPRPGHTDAQRNLISNIHPRGIPCPTAAARIAALIEQMQTRQTSGVAVKEATIAIADSSPATEEILVGKSVQEPLEVPMCFPKEVHEAIKEARRRGVSEIELIRVIRQSCGVSLEDAKCLLITGTLDREQLSEYQERLLAGLKSILEDSKPQAHQRPQ